MHNGLKAAAAFSSWLFTIIKRECRRLERRIGHEPLDEDRAEQALAHRPDHDLPADLAHAL